MFRLSTLHRVRFLYIFLRTRSIYSLHELVDRVYLSFDRRRAFQKSSTGPVEVAVKIPPRRNGLGDLMADSAGFSFVVHYGREPIDSIFRPSLCEILHGCQSFSRYVYRWRSRSPSPVKHNPTSPKKENRIVATGLRADYTRPGKRRPGDPPRYSIGPLEREILDVLET